MKTAEKTFEEIQQAAEKTAPTTRRVEECAFGEGQRQGDLYVLSLGPAGCKLAAALKKLRETAQPAETTLKALSGKVGKRISERQLAVGQTQGSRHVIDPAPAGLVIRAPAKGESPLVGPVFLSPSRVTITHPEHGHLDLPAGAYLVLYQRDFARERADEVRRVQD